MIKKQALKIAIGILVSLIFIGLALYNIDFEKLRQTFSQIKIGWLVAGGILILLTYYLRALLWQQLLRKYKTSQWNLYRIITIGYFANNILPLKLGEIIRAWLLGKRENLPTSQAFATVVMERGMDLFALLFYFILMMFIIPFEGWLKLSGLILAGVGTTFALVVILNYRYGSHLIEMAEKPLRMLPGRIGEWLHIQMGKFLEGLKLIEKPGQFIRIVILALLTWFCWISVAYICFKALGLELSFWAAIFLIIVLNFGLMIPSSPGGLGVFEFMVILALTPYGVEKETALGVGFTFHMLQYILTLALGWIFSIQLNVSMSKTYQHPENPEEDVPAKAAIMESDNL